MKRSAIRVLSPTKLRRALVKTFAGIDRSLAAVPFATPAEDLAAASARGRRSN
jgi:hypothetical protein